MTPFSRLTAAGVACLKHLELGGRDLLSLPGNAALSPRPQGEGFHGKTWAPETSAGIRASRNLYAKQSKPMQDHKPFGRLPATHKPMSSRSSPPPRLTAWRRVLERLSTPGLSLLSDGTEVGRGNTARVRPTVCAAGTLCLLDGGHPSGLPTKTRTELNKCLLPVLAPNIRFAPLFCRSTAG